MTPLWYERLLMLGDFGPDVGVVQRKLGLPVTDLFDQSLVIAVRGLQLEAGIEQSGAVDEETAIVLGPRYGDGLPPDWYKGSPLYPGEQAYGLVLGERDEDWLRRFQGSRGLQPTGIIDEDTALLLGAAGVGDYGDR